MRWETSGTKLLRLFFFPDSNQKPFMHMLTEQIGRQASDAPALFLENWQASFSSPADAT